MSWFNASQLSSFAKQALSQAQKSIDRVLDIQEEEPGAWAEAAPYAEPGGHGGAGAVAWAPRRSAGTGPRSSPVALGAVRRLRVAGCGPQPSRNELRGLGLFEARSRGVAGRARAPPSSGRFRESGRRGPWVTRGRGAARPRDPGPSGPAGPAGGRAVLRAPPSPRSPGMGAFTGRCLPGAQGAAVAFGPKSKESCSLLSWGSRFADLVCVTCGKE